MKGGNYSILLSAPEEVLNYLFLSPQVQERIKRIWDEKLRVTEKEKGEGGLPRIVRLSRRLKLSEKETLVMIYTLTCQVGEARTSTIRFGRFAGRHETVLASFPVLIMTSVDWEFRTRFQIHCHIQKW